MHTQYRYIVWLISCVVCFFSQFRNSKDEVSESFRNYIYWRLNGSG